LGDKRSVEMAEVVEPGQPVRPGDTLALAQPFVFAIQPQYRQKVCENCLLFTEKWGEISLCPDCGAVGYCSEQCRAADRDRHRTECALVALRQKKAIPHRAWLVARAVLRVQEEGYSQQERVNSHQQRAFGDLMDHYEDVVADSSLQNSGWCGWWESEVGELLGGLMPDRREYLGVYGRLLVNSFALRVDNNGEEENVGTVLYRACSIFDHSCRPNATTVFSAGRLRIVATEPSPALDLSTYFISYLDEAMPRPARQAKLRRTWYFECGCVECQDPGGEQARNCAVCEVEECGGRAAVCIATWTWQPCHVCGAELSRAARVRYQETHEMVRQVVDENGGEYQFTDVSEFLVRQMRGLFHPLDTELWQAAQGAAHGHLAGKLLEKALPYLELSLPGVRLYYGRYQGYLAAHLEHLAECLLAGGRAGEATAAITEADSLLRVVPGQESLQYRRYFQPKLARICGRAAACEG